jgi:hypothetical protein
MTITDQHSSFHYKIVQRLGNGVKASDGSAALAVVVSNPLDGEL